MKSIFFAFIYLVFFIQSGLAHETATIICIYPTFSDKDGNQPVSREFKLTFILDHETANAYMLGNLGSVKVQYMPAKGGLSFLEIAASGNLMTTTIDQIGNSVHSRNSIIGGRLVPSQYYGRCTVK